MRLSSSRGKLLVALALVGLAWSARAEARSPASGHPEILWDTWGVPHIFASNGEEMMYAFGWAQMENHADLILRLYGQARGRAAEYWGEEYVDSDRRIRTMGVPRRGGDWYAAQKPAPRRLLDAFVRGMNDWAAAGRARIDPAMRTVLPVAPADVLMHLQNVIHLTFVGGSAAYRGRQWEQRGSNAWAIGPSRSESGHAMLLANPHLPWEGSYTWFEAQLTAPGVDAYGAAFVGMPMLGIAFNSHLGWTHTVNPMDGADLFELELVEGGYRWEEGVRAFETEEQVLRVKGDGGVREEVLPVRRSVHGPVIAEKGGKALALRLVGLDQPHLLEQYWEMMWASDLSQFEAALRRLQMPFFNVVYADRDGHILYLFGGRTPRRGSGGDWQHWSGVVPGTSSANLWTEVHTYEELPRLADPASGWLQNTNDPPWSCAFPFALSPGDFPPYMAPPPGFGFRTQHSIRMLLEDEQMGFDELIAHKFSSRWELADRLLDDLLPAVAAHGGQLAREAADVLTAWDRTAGASSRGSVLFDAWVREATAHGFRTAWQEDRPLDTPDGLVDEQAAVAALDTTAAAIQQKFGSLDVPWGEVYRLRYAGRDLPANGGGRGSFYTLWFREDGDRYRVRGGNSYVAAVEFADPVRARVLLSYGNATQPDSPHRGDQLELLAAGKLRSAWRSREEIEAHLEKREVLSPEEK